MAHKQSSTPTHTVEFPLVTTKEDIRCFTVRAEVGRQLYNSSLGELLRRHQAMINSDAWHLLSQRNKRNNLKLKPLIALKKPTSSQKAKFNALTAIKKRLNGLFNALHIEFGVTEYALNSFSKTNKNACHFKDHLDANTIQKIDKRVMDAFVRWRFGPGVKPRFKGKNRPLNSLEGKTNKQGIRFVLGDDNQPTRVQWNGLSMTVILAKKDRDGYQSAALSLIADGNIAYTRLIKRTVKGRDKLYAQLILKGEAFVKARHQTARDNFKGKRVGTD